MDQTGQPITTEAKNVQPFPTEEKKTVEIVVHVTEELTEEKRDTLTSALCKTTGITEAVFCPLRYHLMLVNYDRETFSSLEVLKTIESHGVQAQLIGPI